MRGRRRWKRYVMCSWLGHRLEPWKFDNLQRCTRCGKPRAKAT